MVRRMKDRARELGVERQVVFAGQVDRLSIPYVLAKSNCAVVPTGAETFGHNFLEPMFAGIPVVGTAVGVGREIVRDGETGFRISLKDKQSVRRAVLTLMDNPDLCARMGETARRLVIERYSHKAIAARHIELYKKLLTEA